jgi:hypothetical protein
MWNPIPLFYTQDVDLKILPFHAKMWTSKHSTFLFKAMWTFSTFSYNNVDFKTFHFFIQAMWTFSTFSYNNVDFKTFHFFIQTMWTFSTFSYNNVDFKTFHFFYSKQCGHFPLFNQQGEHHL